MKIQHSVVPLVSLAPPLTRAQGLTERFNKYKEDVDHLLLPSQQPYLDPDEHFVLKHPPPPLNILHISYVKTDGI